jgi:hypothetical protein
MAKGKARDKSKEAFWRKTMAAYQRSGLRIRQFCRREKLRETGFYFWRRELAQREAERRPKPRRPRALFLPIRLATEPQPATGGEIAIALADGRRIHLTPPVDQQTLRDVLAVMEARPC